jgi:hypothetical protein
MRTTVQVSAAAAGSSAWVPVSDFQNPFSVSLFASFESGGSGTYKVQHTPDDPQALHGVTSITRVGTTATVTDVAHGLATGDSLQVFGTGDSNLDTPTAGLGVDVTVVDANTYTYTVANTGATAAKLGAKVNTLRVFDHPIMTGLTGRQDGNYSFPVRATRARVTVAGAGLLDLSVIQVEGR